MLRKDQRYNLSTGKNEAWVAGRAYGLTTILAEAIKEVTAVGGKVLLICPIGNTLSKLGISTLKPVQDVYSYKRGSITYTKTVTKLDPNDFDLVVIDNIFFLPYKEIRFKWRKLTDSNTKVIVTGTPTSGCNKNNRSILHELFCFYDVTRGSTFDNPELPNSFLRCLLTDSTKDDESMDYFKKSILAMID